MNQCAFRHSALSLPLKASMNPLSVGFPGRVERENWVEEAKVLAAGGTTDHARRVEEGKIATSHVTKAAKPRKS